MKNVTVYRLEDRNTGQGAYVALFFPCRPREGAHPIPENDGKLMDGIMAFAKEHKVDPIQTWGWGRKDADSLDGKAIFGFTTKGMLRRWFNRKDRKNIANSQRADMVIAIYEVHPSAVIAGSTQAIFFPHCAWRVRVLPVNTREI